MYAEPLAPQTPVELLEFLQRPGAYPNQPKRVEMRETHISWIFLAGRYAYKLKKPVHFDFLDFSTCQRRKEACESELRLNRRLSPSVYRAVVPVRRHKSGKLTMVGAGEVVDWLVKMRRLDDRRTLDAVLTGRTNHANAQAQIRAVASRLAQFYATQAPLTVHTSAFRESLRRHVDENEHELLQIASSSTDDDTIHRVHAAQRRFLVTHQDVFDDRVRDGRIVDGHGDLRPEHIYLYNRPLVIDCIEFNAEYRTNDIVDELAFLAMECDRLGDWSVGCTLFEAYACASDDIPLEQLVAFYKAYRACVRAKVAALRSQQQRPNQASSSLQSERDYLRLAEDYTDKLRNPQ